MARPGDYFLTAIPDDEDRPHVVEMQSEIASVLGGEIETYPHLTLQRFEIDDGSVESTLDAIEESIRDVAPPNVVADNVFPTFHRYFERHSIRWKIEPTQDLGHLVLGMKAVVALLRVRKRGVDASPDALGGVLDDHLADEAQRRVGLRQLGNGSVTNMW